MEVWVLGPQIRGFGGTAPRGIQGAEPLLGAWGRSPQKLKSKNGLDACQKALGDVECQERPSEPTLNLRIIQSNPIILVAHFID